MSRKGSRKRVRIRLRGVERKVEVEGNGMKGAIPVPALDKSAQVWRTIG